MPDCAADEHTCQELLGFKYEWNYTSLLEFLLTIREAEAERVTGAQAEAASAGVAGCETGEAARSECRRRVVLHQLGLVRANGLLRELLATEVRLASGGRVMLRRAQPSSSSCWWCSCSCVDAAAPALMMLLLLSCRVERPRRPSQACRASLGEDLAELLLTEMADEIAGFGRAGDAVPTLCPPNLVCCFYFDQNVWMIHSALSSFSQPVCTSLCRRRAHNLCAALKTNPMERGLLRTRPLRRQSGRISRRWCGPPIPDIPPTACHLLIPRHVLCLGPYRV